MTTDPCLQFPGGWRVGNLRADHDAALPSIKMLMTADFVIFYNPTTGLSHIVTTGLSVSGAIVSIGPNLKDQVANFATGETMRWYFIHGPGMPVAGVVSKRKPSEGGPDLSDASFAGYDSFCPAFPIIMYDWAQGLTPVSPLIGQIRYKVRGSTVSFPRTPLFDDHQNYPLMNFNLSAWIPPDALLASFYTDAEMGSGAGGGVTGGAHCHTAEGEFANISLYPPGPCTMHAQDVYCCVALPDTRAFQLTFSVSGGQGNLAFVIGDIFVSGYTFSNG